METEFLIEFHHNPFQGSGQNTFVCTKIYLVSILTSDMFDSSWQQPSPTSDVFSASLSPSLKFSLAQGDHGHSGNHQNWQNILKFPIFVWVHLYQSILQIFWPKTDVYLMPCIGSILEYKKDILVQWHRILLRGKNNPILLINGYTL